MHKSEAELIEGCRQNNRNCQELLYKRYSGLLMGICVRYVKSRTEAEDVLMVGFMKIYKNVGTFIGTGSFEGWMKKIIVFTAIEHYRNMKKTQSNLNGIETFNTGVDDNVVENLSAREILKLMDELPEIYRIVMNLHSVEGFSNKEIAEMLDISEGTIKSQLHRGKILLKELIDKTFLIQVKS